MTTGSEFLSERSLKKAPQKATEITRITRLPISHPISDEEFDAINQQQIKPEAYSSGFRLLRPQAEALLAFAELGGVFAPIPVGGGKTLTCLRCIGIAFERGISRAVLVVPSPVYYQLVRHDIAWVRKRVSLGISFYLMGNKSPNARRALAGDRRGCWVFPYSLMSLPDTIDLLEAIRPQLMVFDEAHYLKNKRTARTQRISTYIKKHRPKVMCCSGTMTAKSLLDYAHLISWCLGENSPVPLDSGLAQEWASVLDSEQAHLAQISQYASKTSTGPLRPLIRWSNNNFPATELGYDVPGFRQAFQNRLLTAPGVISSPPGESDIGTSLTVTNLSYPMMSRPGGAELEKHFQNLDDKWLSPVGDEIEHAMLIWGWKHQLTAGFYYALYWPEPDIIVKKLSIDLDAATDLISRSIKYHEALQFYHKELRHWFSSRPHRAGLDTPMLVGNSMKRLGEEEVGPILYDAWQAKNALDFDGRITRMSEPVRVCDYKIMGAVEWAASQNTGGIIWYVHDEIGEWTCEELKRANIPFIFCPAGKSANAFLTAEDVEDKCKGKILVCSLLSHGTGKNLQFLQNQLFLQMPVTATQAEQGIGRTHRQGQKEDEVIVTTLISNEFDKMALGAILNDAVYVQETMNSRQKVLYCVWDPMPIVYGSEVLIRAGAQAKLLTARQQQLLAERFTQTKIEK